MYFSFSINTTGATFVQICSKMVLSKHDIPCQTANELPGMMRNIGHARRERERAIKMVKKMEQSMGPVFGGTTCAYGDVNPLV